MVKGGIRAIWNLLPVHLCVPAFVILQNEDLYHLLASLSFRPVYAKPERIYAKPERIHAKED